MATRIDEHVTLLGAPLRDAQQDVTATVGRLLEVVADLPKRLNADSEDYATAVAALSEGLLTTATGQLADDADADDFLELVQVITDQVPTAEGVDFAVGLRAIADVLDPE